MKFASRTPAPSYCADEIPAKRSLSSPVRCLLLSVLLVGSLPAQPVIFEASDGAASDYFGFSSALFEDSLLSGAYYDSWGAGSNQGSAYLFLSIESASGTTSETAILRASDAANYDYFGRSVAMGSGVALVGAPGDNTSQGSVYRFLNPSSATGTVNEDAKLEASTGAAGDNFGEALALSGDRAVVGAYNTTTGGTAYYFDVTLPGPTINETARLSASDAAAGDYFGAAVALDGDTAVVGARQKNTQTGAAYLFLGLDSASGDVTETAKLAASDGATFRTFGQAVAVKGNAVAIGSPGSGPTPGAAYLYFDVSSASGTVTEDVKLVSSVATAGQGFGSSVSIEDDPDVTGLEGGLTAFTATDNAGHVHYFVTNLTLPPGPPAVLEETFWIRSNAGTFTGPPRASDSAWLIGADPGGGAARTMQTLPNVSTFTTKDDESLVEIHASEFQSNDNWIIGVTSDGNQLIFNDSSANVTQAGKKVHVGSGAGSDNNNLTLAGTSHLQATEFYLGVSASIGNSLQIDSTSTFDVDFFRLTEGNFLSIEGDFTDITNLLTYLDDTALQVWGGSWLTMTSGNYIELVDLNFLSGYTQVLALAPVPEPATWAAILGVVALGAALRRRRTKP